MTEAQKIKTLTEALWNALNQMNMEGGIVRKYASDTNGSGISVFECHQQTREIILNALRTAEDGEGWR